MANNTSPHIINTAANLLGFCLFVITSYHLTSYSNKSNIDELTSVVAIMLALSCTFSFSSIRTKDSKNERILERIADAFFMVSLVGVIVVIILITLNILN